MRLQLAANLVFFPRSSDTLEAVSASATSRKTIPVLLELLPILTAFVSAATPDEVYERTLEEFEIERVPFDAVLAKYKQAGVLVEVGDASSADAVETPEFDQDYDADLYKAGWSEYWEERMPTLLDTYLLTEPSQRRGPMLDLGCGAGGQALVALEAGLDVHGIDIDAGMIRRSRETAEEFINAGRAQFEVANGCTLKLDRRFPLVTALHSVVAHLFEDSALCAFLQNAAAHLDDDGLFVFDFWTEQGLRKIFRDRISFEPFEDGSWTVDVRATTRTPAGFSASIKTDMFFPVQQGWFRHARTHVSVSCHELDMVRGALADAGFKDVVAFDGDAMEDLEDKPASTVLIFAAKKKGIVPRKLCKNGPTRAALTEARQAKQRQA